jgi:hypothetical protein
MAEMDILRRFVCVMSRFTAACRRPTCQPAKREDNYVCCVCGSFISMRTKKLKILDVAGVPRYRQNMKFSRCNTMNSF